MTAPSRAPASPGRCWTERPERTEASRRIARTGPGPARGHARRARGSSPRRTRHASSSMPPEASPARCGRSWSGAWPASRWPGSPVGRLRRPRRAGRPRRLRPTLAEHPAGPPRRRPAPRAAAPPSTCAPGPGPSPWPCGRPSPRPGSSPPTSTPRRGLRPRQRRRGLRGRPLRAGAARSSRAGPTWSWPSCPTSPPPTLRLLPRDTLTFEDAGHYDGGPDGTAVLRRVATEAPAVLAPGRRAAARSSAATRPTLLRPLLERLGYGPVETWSDDGRRPAGPRSHAARD